MSSSSQDTTLTKPNEDEIRKCSYLWTVDDYPTISKKQGGKLTSEKFSATDEDFNWRLERIENDGDVSFYLRPDCYDELRYCELVDGDVDFYIRTEKNLAGHNDDTRNTFVCRQSSFTFSCVEGESNCKVFGHKKKCLRNSSVDWELSIFVNLTYTKKNSKISKYSIMSTIRLSIDLEKCFNDDHFKDVTISVKGEQYRAHKTILTARSLVFDRMLNVDMSESTNNCIHITDIDPKIFEEMLYYIYTGMVRNLDETAFELLQAADKYDLKELKSMCEDVLIETLATDNAAKFLINADTYGAEKLKAHTLRFIKENYDSCEEFNDDKYWKDLVAGNCRLMKEMVAAFCKKQKMS